MEVRLDELCNNKVNENTNSTSNVDKSFALHQGTYNDKYCPLEQIGCGAFGCVKTAFRRSDKKMVTTYISTSEKENFFLIFFSGCDQIHPQVKSIRRKLGE